MRSSRILTSSALFVVVAGTAACGVASAAPKVQLRDAFGALGDARTASFTVSLPSSEKDVRAYLRASGESEADADSVLKELLAGEFVLSYDNGQRGDSTDDAGQFQLRFDGETYGEMRFVDQVAYARVDLDGLGERFPEMNDGLDELRDQIDARDLGNVEAPAQAALDGDWVSLDMGEGSWFAEQQQQMEDAGAPLTEDVREQLFDAAKKAFESSVSLRAAGTDDIGDRIILTTNTRELYTDLADELPELLSGFAPGAEESLPDAEDVPDVDAKALIWLDDSKLRRFELDLAQFLEEPAGHMVVRVDIADGGAIEAPDDAVAIDFEQLMTLGAGGYEGDAAYEGTGDYSGGFLENGEGVREAATAVGDDLQSYASYIGEAPTVSLLPDIAPYWTNMTPPVELIAVGDRIQVTFNGEVACLTLGPDVETPGTVAAGPC